MQESAGSAFGGLASLYDMLTDWESRLDREVEFLHRLLAAEGARTVHDAACGTGMHLLALSRLGYLVSGSDLSPEMVERARTRLSGVPGAEVRTRGFSRLPEVRDTCDAVLVIGNSLPNAGTADGVRESLSGLSRALRPGGLLVLHMLNFPRLREVGGGLRPLRRVQSGGREHIFLKLFDVRPESVVLNVIALVRDGDELDSTLLRSVLFPVDLPWLERECASAGLLVERTWGGFDGSPYDEGGSGDLLVAARRL